MISVLLPSRGRPEALIESVASLRDNADDPDRVEVLVAVDADDPATRTAALVSSVTGITTFEERHGYSGLYHYVNELARKAMGDWLFLWNDDARMLTAGWDRIVHDQAPAVLWPHSNDIPTCNTFPLWPKAWTDLIGHVSLSPHCDSWIQYLGQTLGLHHRVPIQILHDRADLTGGHDDQTRAESLAGYRTAEYGSPAMGAARAADIAALRALIGQPA